MRIGNCYNSGNYTKRMDRSKPYELTVFTIQRSVSIVIRQREEERVRNDIFTQSQRLFPITG